MADYSEVIYQKLSAKAAEKLGLPEGFKTFTPFPFGGVNQQSSRVALADSELFYLENYIRIGDGNLRTLWDLGVPIYTVPAGKNIVSFFFYNLGSTNYAAVFLNDGTGLQVNSTTSEQTTLSAIPGTFYVPGSPLPACSQWGALYLIIANNITPNSYWIWDGSILYSPGGLGPGVTITDGGTDYTSAPSVAAFGGSGSGITAVATIANGSVVLVTITNPGTGYLPGDIVQFAFSGGGSDTSAILAASITAGVIESATLVAGGSGYTAGTLTFTGGGGSSAAGTYAVTDGVVTSLTITDGGSGYTGSPTIGFSAGGTGASAVAVLSAGSVTSITVVNGGSDFSATPTLTIEGGGGTGATAVANMSGGAIASVTVLTNGTGYTSDPAVVVQTAVNNAAAATATLMPFGVSGSSIEIYQQRVWLPYPNQTGNQENGGTFLMSAPGSLTDFATSDGGVTYTSTDSFLRYQYTNIKQSNGYLYPIGDSSVDVISNVQTGGNPSVTTFNYQNTDPQTGTSWRDTVVPYSRTILLANPFGVYGLYGGAVTKISGKLDNLFTNYISPANGGVTPCSALANIFSQKMFLMLMTITDIFTGDPRNVMIAWNEKEWFVTSQSIPLTYIGSQEVNSTMTAWGTDGNALYPLFNAPSSQLEKTLSTKNYGAQTGFVMKQALSIYAQVQDLTVTGTGVDFITTIDTEEGSFPLTNGISLPAQVPQTPPSAPIISVGADDIYGTNIGVTMTSTSPDFTLNNLMIGYVDTSGLFGSTNLTNETGE